jgi:carbamoyltransferase
LRWAYHDEPEVRRCNEIELLVVGNCMPRKGEQNPALKIDYKDEFEPD